MTLPQLALDIPAVAGDPLPLPMHGRWVIGSDASKVDQAIEDPDVEGVHCVLLIAKDGTVEVQDLGSLSGIKINGQAVQKATLSLGDRLELGSVRIWLIDESAPPSEMASNRVANASASDLPTVPGYELKGVLGQGSSGSVYLAVQTSLQREVALKVLSPKLAHDANVVREFQQEARGAAALAHNHVVTVYDVGSQGSLHYLSMEHMDGGSWDDRLQAEGPLPWRAVLRALTETASALEFAESRSLVHRDIKPANLMTTRQGVTKLADLGLVLDTSGDTSQGPILGTPHFLAPELIQGGAPSPLSDLYALGASAYQMLSGRTPFQGKTTPNILREVLHATPPPLHELDSDLPLELCALIEHLMSKDPSARPQGAAALTTRLEALQLSLGEQPVAARGGPAKWGLAALLLIGIGAGAWWMTRESKPADVEQDPNAAAAQVPDVAEDGSTETSEPENDALSFATDGGPEVPSFSGDPEVEQAFERTAQDAFSELNEQDWTEQERIDKLREFAQTYRGSSVADEALTLAGSMEEQHRGVAREQQRRTAALQGERDRLRKAALWDKPKPDQVPVEGTPPSGEPLIIAIQRALDFVPTMDALDLANFEVTRAEVIADLWKQGTVTITSSLAAQEAATEAGAFDAALEALRALDREWSRTLAFNMPEPLNSGPAYEAQETAREAGARIQPMLEGLPARQDEWASRLEAQDRQIFAQQLGRHSALLEEMRAFDLDAVQSRLEAALQQLRTPEAQAWVGMMLEDIRLADAARARLIEDFASGDWRRTSTLDPREARPTNRTVNAISKEAVTLDGDRVGWKSFFANRNALAALVLDRTKTSDSPAAAREQHAVLRLQATVSFRDQIHEMFRGGSNAKFTEGEVEDALAVWDELPLPPNPEAREAVLREQRVARPLAQALYAVSRELPGSAAGYLERATELGQGTWSLAWLTDGRSLVFSMPRWKANILELMDEAEAAATSSASGTESDPQPADEGAPEASDGTSKADPPKGDDEPR